MASKRRAFKHALKTWPTYFEGVLDGSKPFELRKDDRGFREGDALVLREWNPVTERYTGREVEVRVTCIVDSLPEWGLMEGYCIMGITRANPK